MNNSEEFAWLHGRYITFSELNYGRPSGYNPVLTQTITVIQQFDPRVGDFRPIAIPVTQILDPFGERTYQTIPLQIQRGEKSHGAELVVEQTTKVRYRLRTTIQE
ncbi:hypothetical protein ACKWTF_002075 [Chironomus riparius]